jgi:hypothetical protein
MDLKDLRFEDGMWMKLNGYHVRWQTLVLMVLRVCLWYYSVSYGAVLLGGLIETIENMDIEKK